MLPEAGTSDRKAKRGLRRAKKRGESVFRKKEAKEAITQKTE